MRAPSSRQGITQSSKNLYKSTSSISFSDVPKIKIQALSPSMRSLQSSQAEGQRPQPEKVLISRITNELDSRFAASTERGKPDSVWDSEMQTHEEIYSSVCQTARESTTGDRGKREESRREEGLVSRLEKRAAGLEQIISSYLTCREKAPFSRRELISLFREVINDLKRSSDRIRDQRLEMSSQSAEILTLKGSRPREDVRGLLEAKLDLEEKVRRLRLQFDRKAGELEKYREKGAAETEKMKGENEQLRKGLERVASECTEALRALERKEHNRKRRECEDRALFLKCIERVSKSTLKDARLSHFMES